MKDKPYYAIVFMFLITVFFSSILIGFSRFTRPLVLANERLAFEKAVLAVLPVNLPDNPSNLQMHQAFVEQVTEPDALTGAGSFRRSSALWNGKAGESGQHRLRSL